jgi:hypothetical protein
MALYADIIEIVAPGEVQAGSRVDITVRIKNTHSAAIGIKVVGVPEYEGLPSGLYIQFPVSSVNVEPGAINPFSGYFTMPEKKVTIHAYSYWYGADNLWHLDDEMTKLVNLAEVVVSQFGSIEIVSYERRL